MPVALSAKRSLGGQTGRLSENILRNGMTDNKIGGRYNGQMGGNGTHRLCAGIDGGTGHRLADGCAAQCRLRTGFRGHGIRGQGRPARLGRSLPHLIETVGKLEARGVGFRSLTENIDTTTPGGRLIFHVFGALGQFERDLIRERTKAGLTAAAARGRKGGRKPVVTADKLQRARELVANGLNVREAAARLKVGKTALYAALQAASSGSAADS